MLIAATVFTTKLSRLHRRWRIESSTQSSQPLLWKKPDFEIRGTDETGRAVTGNLDYAGLMLVYDWDTGHVVWESSWDAIVVPAGFCFADESIYLNDSEGCSIFQVDLRTEMPQNLRRISHPYFNDLHSIYRSRRGLLVTCSGNDLIVEVDLRGKLLFEWWAAEHGYISTPAGIERVSGRGIEHRTQYYHTKYHATHINSAVFRDQDERFVLALLFQQGTLIEIDRGAEQRDGSVRVVLDGLVCPHGLERTSDGWLICNTLGKELVVLDDRLNVRERIPYIGGWIQDCTRLSNGNLLLVDVDEHRIVELAAPKWNVIRILDYHQDWRMAEVNEIPPPYARSFPKQTSKEGQNASPGHKLDRNRGR
jgi:hypothetical protein